METAPPTRTVRSSYRLVANEEVEVLGSALPGQMSAGASSASQKGRLVGNSWSPRS